MNQPQDRHRAISVEVVLIGNVLKREIERNYKLLKFVRLR